METITKYFPGLTDRQLSQFQQLEPLYRDWNEKINVISRKDIDNLYQRHVLHSLALVPVVRFRAGSSILDLGTGGGFPGIPLAIFYPRTEFLLIDGTGKKIGVVQEIIQALGLENATARHVRAEDLKKVKFDFVVSRAVASLDKLTVWSNRLLAKEHRHALPNGLLALKGGTLKEELKALPKGTYTEQYHIADFFDEPALADKSVIYVQK